MPSDKKITKSALSKTKTAEMGDLLFSIIDPATNKISFAGESTSFNQSIARVFNSKKNLFLELKNLMDYFSRVKNGAAQQSINKTLIEESTVELSEINF